MTQPHWMNKDAVNNVRVLMHYKLNKSKQMNFEPDGQSNQLVGKPVAVILGYFDGESYISEQLQSIFDQSHTELHVFLYDDHSTRPFSVNALNLNSDQLGKLSVQVRPENVGFVNNFLNALASIDGAFEYFAFSDQDDVWHINKLDRALNALSTVSNATPALYCARTEIMDATCEHTLGYSPRFNKPPSFANALVQSIGGGNTMVFNKAAKDLIVASIPENTVISHDWWCYQIISGAGGCVVYDPEPCIKYRQHNDNLIGQNVSWQARFLRLYGFLQGHFRKWNDTNLKALADHEHLLTAPNQQILKDFIGARKFNFLRRLVLFKRSGIYRQTLLDNLSLFFGILLNKV